MTQIEQPPIAEPVLRYLSLRRAWYRVRRSPLTLLGAAIMIAVLFLMLFSPWLVPHNPDAIDLTARLLPPSPEHWFGTDEVGRDLFSRVLVGSRQSVAAGLAVVVLAARLFLRRDGRYG